MLEVLSRDGRGRLCRWESGRTVETPLLLVPDTSLGVPSDAQAVLVAQATGRDALEIVAQGTWFHPRQAGELVVPATPPAPTHQVQVTNAGELAVFHDARGWASDPAKMVPALVEARSQAGPARLLWAPGLGTPADYAVWVYAGVDVFDATPLLLAAARGQAVTVDGIVPAEEVDAPAGAALAAWNIARAHDELRLIRRELAKGSLRALAERRAYARAGAIEVLRRLDREHAYLEAATATHRTGTLPCHTIESLQMPEVERFRRRLRERYVRPAGADVLVLLPCSAKKPYRISKSHRYFQRALDDSGVRHRVHEVMVTSPLGLVPRDLENLYPASNYDVPVTGQWFRDEEHVILTQLRSLVQSGRYTHIVVHADEKTTDLVRRVVPDAVATGDERPAGIEACARLKEHLAGLDLERAEPRGAGARRKLADLAALASFQWGAKAAAALTTGAKAHGRAPFVKMDAETQLGMTTPERGMLSLTLDGARRIAPYEGHRVWMQDFQLKGTGSLFSVGIERADADVRPGDEVVLLHGNEVRGVGVAQMPAEEMGVLKRGVAVQLRHIVKEVTA